MAKATIAFRTAFRTKTRALIGRFRVGVRILLAAHFLLVSYGQIFSQEFRPTESQVEAADLYNFGKFVTWPDERLAKTETFQICILGKDPFGVTIDSIVSGASIGGKKVRVQRIRAVRQVQPCMILFVSASEVRRLPKILVTAQNFSVLTVSDVSQFAELGGDIGLVRQEDHVRFEVNRTAAEHCHLVMSSELLKLAIRVISEP